MTFFRDRFCSIRVGKIFIEKKKSTSMKLKIKAKLNGDRQIIEEIHILAGLWKKRIHITYLVHCINSGEKKN